jgi:hypothetical protein
MTHGGLLFLLEPSLVHEHLVSGVVLLSHSFIMPYVRSFFVFGPFAPLIVSFLQALVDNTYPKGYTNDNKGGVVIELKVISYAIEKLG